jgi:hypothetical protein
MIIWGRPVGPLRQCPSSTNHLSKMNLGSILAGSIEPFHLSTALSVDLSLGRVFREVCPDLYIVWFTLRPRLPRKPPPCGTRGPVEGALHRLVADVEGR